MKKNLNSSKNCILIMEKNSIIVKIIAITNISIVLVLAASTTNLHYLLFAFVPTLLFWLMDSYFVYREKIYRQFPDQSLGNFYSELMLSPKSIFTELRTGLLAIFSSINSMFYGAMLLTLSILSLSLL
ncbi:hypothetical protein IFO69_09525 [Echinicola sp. CAU 1574]|uniref:Uncharacterized protein n=1 Tax=Echinicola arenosa TaxID=2774144 RepID=A0ABR9AJK0_9BACT|nr:hypothetical protein [Echinicola arenosa]MBD8488983.1 hypothetical protein [Echinicola arenosa]